MANWAELLPDLLSIIAKKVKSYEDFTAFGGVCRSWRSVAAVKDNFCPVNQVPCLVFAEDLQVDSYCDFYSLTKGGMVRKDLPEGNDKILQSSLGWLISIGQYKMKILHPLSQDWIGLPGNFMSLDLKRAVLSASPSHTEDYALMIIIGWDSHLAYWKPGYTAWTRVDVDRYARFKDIVYYQGQFYAISNPGNLFCVNVNGPEPTRAKLIRTTMIPSPEYGRFYLVESGGDLLAVFRKLVHSPYQHNGTWDWHYQTVCFSVYRIPIPGDVMVSDFEQIDDLGVRSLFVGKGEAISIVASDPAIRPNCIYFTDDSCELVPFNEDMVKSDMGIYSLREESIETFYEGHRDSRLPFWVSPSF